MWKPIEQFFVFPFQPSETGMQDVHTQEANKETKVSATQTRNYSKTCI